LIVDVDATPVTALGQGRCGPHVQARVRIPSAVGVRRSRRRRQRRTADGAATARQRRIEHRRRPHHRRKGGTPAVARASAGTPSRTQGAHPGRHRRRHPRLPGLGAQPQVVLLGRVQPAE
jgi:hypothetical protein